MKRFLSIIVLSLCLSVLSSYMTAKADTQPSGHVFTVTLDPGHGGKDPGACGPTAQEKNIVLSVAKRVGKRLAAEHPSDIKVVYTRSSDVFVELEQRAVIANKAKSDIFIAIHTDAVKSRSVYGASSFTMGLSKEASNLEVAQRENSVILYEDNYQQRYEGFDPNSAESYIMFELMQDINMEQSITLASSIQNNIVSRKRLDRGVRQAPYWVLHRTSMPSVLVELGFISNVEEEKYLKSEKGQTELANSIYEAIIRYKNDWDSKSSTHNGTVSPAPAQSPADVQTDIAPADELVFAVQIATSGKLLKSNDAAFKGLKPITHFKGKNLYKYIYGSFQTEAEAQKARKSIRSKFPDSFVIAIRNGEPISLEEARKR